MSKFITDGWTGQLVPSFCPRCFKLLNAATNMEGKDKPEPGDFTICIKCSSVLRFNPDMQLELAHLDMIPAEARPSFEEIIRAVRQIPW